MHDLTTLINAHDFNLSPEAPTCIAMVHRSFRSVSTRRGIERQRFGAHFPALGLLNLAHALRVDAQAGAFQTPTCRYFDEESYEDEDGLIEAVASWLEGADRRIIAASAYTSTIDALESFLHAFDPSRYLVVVGGAHATVAPDVANAHLVVRGEGRSAIRHIVSTFLSPVFTKTHEAKGICYRLSGQDYFSTASFDNSLEALPPPAYAYDLLDQQRPIYATNFTRMLGKHPQIYVCTQSCRARCSFCSTYLIHGKAVARPVQLIHDDLHYLLQSADYDSIEFHDDDLMQHPEFNELLRLMAELGVPWFCFARSDGIDKSIAKDMAASGCRRVFLGLESMQQEKLDYLNKWTTVERNRGAVEALASVGIGIVAGFIIGIPNDTVESILADLDMFLELPLHSINCSILSPDPGTQEFYRAKARAKRINPELVSISARRIIPDPMQFGIDAPMGLPSVCERVSKSDLNCLQTVIETEFYFRHHIWKSLTACKTPGQVEVVRDYYKYLRMALRNTDEHHRAPEVQHRILLARERSDHTFWREQLQITT